MPPQGRRVHLPQPRQLLLARDRRRGRGRREPAREDLGLRVLDAEHDGPHLVAPARVAQVGDLLLLDVRPAPHDGPNVELFGGDRVREVAIQGAEALDRAASRSDLVRRVDPAVRAELGDGDVPRLAAAGDPRVVVAHELRGPGGEGAVALAPHRASDLVERLQLRRNIVGPEVEEAVADLGLGEAEPVGLGLAQRADVRREGRERVGQLVARDLELLERHLADVHRDGEETEVAHGVPVSDERLLGVIIAVERLTHLGVVGGQGSTCCDLDDHEEEIQEEHEGHARPHALAHGLGFLGHGLEHFLLMEVAPAQLAVPEPAVLGGDLARIGAVLDPLDGGVATGDDVLLEEVGLRALRGAVALELGPGGLLGSSRVGSSLVEGRLCVLHGLLARLRREAVALLAGLAQATHLVEVLLAGIVELALVHLDRLLVLGDERGELGVLDAREPHDGGVAVVLDSLDVSVGLGLLGRLGGVLDLDALHGVLRVDVLHDIAVEQAVLERLGGDGGQADGDDDTNHHHSPDPAVAPEVGGEDAPLDDEIQSGEADGEGEGGGVRGDAEVLEHPLEGVEPDEQEHRADEAERQGGELDGPLQAGAPEVGPAVVVEAGELDDVESGHRWLLSFPAWGFPLGELLENFSLTARLQKLKKITFGKWAVSTFLNCQGAFQFCSYSLSISKSRSLVTFNGALFGLDLKKLSV